MNYKSYILRATLEHLDNLAPLFDAYRVWYKKQSDLDGSKRFLSERLSKSDSVIFLAWNGEKAIGFTQLYPSFSSTRLQRIWILNDLFVHPDYRGQGISKLLITAAKELCTKTQAFGILLETETSNDIGNQLYPAMGFSLEQNNFYFWVDKTADS